MKNIFNKLLVVLSVAVLLVTITPNAFALNVNKEAFDSADLKCDKKGYYKVIVKNGWSELPFPIWVGKSNSDILWTPAGATKIFEISKKELDAVIQGLKEMDVTINLSSREKMNPEEIYFMTDVNGPEDEKYTLEINHCLKGNCDVKKYSVENCNGHIVIHVIKGHPLKQQEVMKKWTEEGRDFIFADISNPLTMKSANQSTDQ